MSACSFTIFTMTSGFGLLECGRVAAKDEVNVMVKNVVDMIFGGKTFDVLCHFQRDIRSCLLGSRLRSDLRLLRRMVESIRWSW